MDAKQKSLKYLSPENLYSELERFTAGMRVTKGSFELVVEDCLVQDVEWNHMDQMHRPTIHHTYEKGIRIASGENFAVSLTQWGRWPLFITVSDVYVGRGLFYQSLVIAGIVFIHSIISLEQMGEHVKLKDEWYIASHRVFSLIHPLLNKKLYKLNARLQEEDKQIRQGRLVLRKEGYSFQTDQPNYHNSNVLTKNTIYPPLQEGAVLLLVGISEVPTQKKVANLTFIVQKTAGDVYRIWPAACPHEGGPLIQGSFCENKVQCPWHGLKFAAAELSTTINTASKHGFDYFFDGQAIHIKQTSQPWHSSKGEALESVGS